MIMILRLLFFILVVPGYVLSQELQKNNVPDVIDRTILPGSINTKDYAEYAPSITGDGKTIIFLRNQNGVNQLYESNLLTEGSWTESIPLEQVNDYFFSGSIQSFSISYDGNYLYLSGKSDINKKSEDIFISKKVKDSWSTPENIGSPINTTGFEGFPSCSPDNTSMYFSRVKQPIDMGRDKKFEDVCYEIYVSNIDSAGNWLEPVKLPYPINDQCEKAGRILSDNTTLVFLAYRSGQEQAGYSLYLSRSDEDGFWSSPVPLEILNNTPVDFLPCIPVTGNSAYFSWHGDLYSIRLPADKKPLKRAIIKGKVLDAGSFKIIPSEIIVRNSETNKVILHQKNNPENGSFYLSLPLGNVYSIEYRQNGFSTVMNTHDLRNEKDYSEIEQDIHLFSTVFLSLRIMDNETSEILKADLKIFETEGSRELSLPKNENEHGLPEILLPVDATYKIQVQKKNYEDLTMLLDLSDPVVYREIESEIYMKPEKIEVPIHLIDKNKNQQIPGFLKIRNMSREELLEIYANERVRLRTGDRYNIEVETDQRYFSVPVQIKISKEGIKITNDSKSAFTHNQMVQIQLTPIEIGATIIAEDIYFEKNSTIVSASAYSILNRLVNIMKKYPTMVIEVSLKSSRVVSVDYASELLTKRTAGIRDYLIIHGIDANRIECRKAVVIRQKPDFGSENGKIRYRAEIKVVEVL